MRRKNVIRFIVNHHDANQLRATADVGGGIGRSSEMDRSKALDLYFSELHRRASVEFPGLRQKMPLQKQNDSPFLNIFARKIHQHPATSPNRLDRQCEFGGKVRGAGLHGPENFVVPGRGGFNGRMPLNRGMACRGMDARVREHSLLRNTRETSAPRGARLCDEFSEYEENRSARNDSRFLPEQPEQPEQSGNDSAENGRISRVTCSDQRI